MGDDGGWAKPVDNPAVVAPNDIQQLILGAENVQEIL